MEGVGGWQGGAKLDIFKSEYRGSVEKTKEYLKESNRGVCWGGCNRGHFWASGSEDPWPMLWRASRHGPEGARNARKGAVGPHLCCEMRPPHAAAISSAYATARPRADQPARRLSCRLRRPLAPQRCVFLRRAMYTAMRPSTRKPTSTAASQGAPLMSMLVLKVLLRSASGAHCTTAGGGQGTEEPVRHAGVRRSSKVKRVHHARARPAPQACGRAPRQATAAPCQPGGVAAAPGRRSRSSRGRRG